MTGPTVAPADVATFRDELYKLGFTDEQRDDAVTVLPYLLAHWSPQDAAEALASVVNPTGSDNMVGCAMAARYVATFAATHPPAERRVHARLEVNVDELQAYIDRLRTQRLDLSNLRRPPLLWWRAVAAVAACTFTGHRWTDVASGQVCTREPCRGRTFRRPR